MPNGNIGVVITNHRLLNKRFPLPDHKFRPGEEWTVYFTPAQARFHRVDRLLKLADDGGALFLRHNLIARHHDLKIASAELRNCSEILGKKQLSAGTPLTQERE